MWGAYALGGLSMLFALYVKVSSDGRIEAATARSDDAIAIADAARKRALESQDEAFRAQEQAQAAQRSADGAISTLRNRAILDADRVRFRECDDFLGERRCKLVK